MKVLMINGSPHEKGCTYTGLCEIQKVLEKEGIDSEIFWIGTKPIAGCISCGKCDELGRCIFDDPVNEAARRAAAADALIVGSPVHYAAVSGAVSSFMDRLFYSAGSVLRGKPGAAVVSCRRGGASAAFDEMNKYFSINCMPIVTSQYWNQIHGSTPEQVLEDAEGMQTLRTLGTNMAWLLKSIDAGRRAGIPAPQYEKHVWTNFIR
ncbi:MAG: flavodoxin family protein [Lachnospiraceae bacterium]|jgi:multimeric flavodoxin WrbA|nr:flavodoxin family protein [Lachnospiraceae bacterium]MCI1727605.1 flavodoxin family protein [Lachnospiraceae bacterium]